MTLPEVQLWILLRRDGIGTRYRRRHPSGPFVLDFYAPDRKLAVEIDGAAHDHPANAARDLAREDWLAARGIRVLRFNAMEVLIPSRRNGVVETIIAVIASRAQGTSPVTRGRGTAEGDGGGRPHSGGGQV